MAQLDVRRSAPAAPPDRVRAVRPRPAPNLPRAVGGALVSLAGVSIGIAALLLVRGHPAEPALPAASVPSIVPSPAAPPAARPPDVGELGQGPGPTASAAPGSVPVTVLNNSRHPGMAAQAASRLQGGGHPIAAVGNFTGRIPMTTVYYEPGQEDAARALAAAFPAVRRVLPRFPGLPGSGLTVVVTRDFARR